MGGENEVSYNVPDFLNAKKNTNIFWLSNSRARNKDKVSRLFCQFKIDKKNR